MLGLVFKDFLILKWQIGLGFLLGIWILVPVRMSDTPMLAFNTTWLLIWFILARGLFALDAYDRGEAIVNSLPLSKLEIVAGRHLSSLAFVAYGFLVTFIWFVILKFAGLYSVENIPWSSFIAVGLILAGFMTVLLFPMLFKLNFVKARWFSFFVFILIFIPFLQSGRRMPTPDWVETFARLNSYRELGLAVLCFAALMLFSTMISAKLYRSREF